LTCSRDFGAASLVRSDALFGVRLLIVGCSVTSALNTADGHSIN